MAKNWAYKVSKDARDGQGKWFTMRGSRTFASEAEALGYAKGRADEMCASYGSSDGIRIAVRSRKGGRNGFLKFFKLDCKK